MQDKSQNKKEINITRMHGIHDVILDWSVPDWQELIQTIKPNCVDHRFVVQNIIFPTNGLIISKLTEEDG